MGLRFDKIKFDAVLSELEETDRWLSSIGIDTAQGRFREILNLNQIIVEHQRRGDIEGLIEKYNYIELYYALTEAFIFLEIYRAFKMEKSHLLPRSQLKKMLGGTFLPWEEPIQGDNNRNTLFELEVAAKLKKSGIEVNGFDDVDFFFGGKKFNVQCKRIHSERKIIDNIKEAADQLGKRMMANSGSRGIICLSIDKILGKERMFLNAKDELEVGETMGELSREFIRNYRVHWHRLLNINIVGTLVFFHIVAIIREMPFDLLTTSRNIDLDLIPQKEHLQASDLIIMRQLAERIGGTVDRM